MVTFTRDEHGRIFRPTGVVPKLKLTAKQIEAERKTRLEAVVCQERYDRGPFDFGDGNPGSLDRVIASLVAIRESIPKRYRDAAFCEFGSRGGYDGDHSPEIEVHYNRPETDDEVVERLSAAAHAHSTQERAEREQLAALQKKYAAPPQKQE